MTEKEMTFLQHLTELRKYVIRSFLALVLGAVVIFFLYDFVIRFLSAPFEQIEKIIGGKELYINSIFEGFLVKIKVAILFGLVLTFPIHLIHLIQFVFPALKRKEKKIVLIVILASFLLIVTSIFYTYAKIIPISIAFLTGVGFIPENVGLLLSYGSNIFFVFQFLLAALILFQVPLILVILMMMNILKRITLVSYHRYIVVGILVVCAVITPPDPASLLALSLPLIGFFYLTILTAKIFHFGD